MNNPGDDLFRIEEFPAGGELPLEAVNASLASAEAALNEKRRAFAEAAQRRAEIEAKLDEAHAAYLAGREAREHTESLADGFRSAEQFAASVRSEADRNGEHDRAQHERMVEERAAYEATLFLARSSQERESEALLEAERLDFERKLAAELGRQASLGDEYENAEAVAAALRGQVASARVEAIEPVDPAHDPDADERKRRDLRARIAQLTATERAAAQERAEAERLLASLEEQPAAVATALDAPMVPQPKIEAPQPKIEAPQPNGAKPLDGTVVAIAETIFGLFARRPRKK